jgi:hypothetical protein
MTTTLAPADVDDSEIAAQLEAKDLNSATLESFAFRSFRFNRIIAQHANASPDLLAKLALSPDAATRRRVAMHPQTPKEVLLSLAPSFPAEFFLNPIFDLLLMEDPNLLFSLPVVVMKNILRRDDCPQSLINWAVARGDKSHQLAIVGRMDLTREMLQKIADGPHIKAAEVAAGRLLAGNFRP